MSDDIDHTVDVLVVGAGPTGLVVAGDLARAGRSVAVLERWPTSNPTSRAFMTTASTLEVLDARGLAEGLLAASSTAETVTLFGGATLDLRHLRSRYRYGMITPQTNVDEALARYTLEQGAAVHRGVEVVGLTQDENGVTLTTRGKDDDDRARRETWRARYAVGADGAHSTVRRLLGIAFPGHAVLTSAVLADVKLASGPDLVSLTGLTMGNTRDEFGFLAPYGRRDADGSWFRSMTWDRRHQVPDTAPVDEHEITSVLNRAMGRDVGVVEVGWHSRFHCDERQVTRYRTGRVFLAGDAAHVHSPAGGQGMNTGIQDGVNLAWKLDAVLGGAADAVLDTYHAERHPIGRRVVRQSGLMLRAVTLHPRPARWLRDLLAPRLLAVPRIRDAVAGSFAGTTLRYAAPPGAHRLVGTLASEVPLDGPRLTELLRRPGFVLVRAREDHRVDVDPADGETSGGLTVTRRTDDGPALLVRPDGYVAWAGAEKDTEPGDAGWRAALRAWTGTADREPPGGAPKIDRTREGAPS